MSTVKIPIENASRDELFRFGTEVLGLDIDKRCNEATVRGKISNVFQGDMITLNTSDAHDHQAGDAPAIKEGVVYRGGGKGDPKVTLVVNEQEGEGGRRPVFVSVNGVAMLIPRNKKVTIAYRYYEALKNAVRTSYEQDQRSGDIHSSDVPTYPFNIVSMPSEDEIEAWMRSSQDIAA